MTRYKTIAAILAVLLFPVFVPPLFGADVPGPRDHHYTFAHRALPSLLFTRKDDLIRAFENRGQSFVDELWTAAGKTTAEKGSPQLDRTGLAYSKIRIDDVNFYIVTLPKSVAVAEAYMVAVAEKNGRARYFTLELTSEASRCPHSTILGEWQEDGQHRNYGCGPAVDRMDFVKAIAKKL